MKLQPAQLLHKANETFLKALCAAHKSKIHRIFRAIKQEPTDKASPQNAALALCSGLLGNIKNESRNNKWTEYNSTII